MRTPSCASTTARWRGGTRSGACRAGENAAPRRALGVPSAVAASLNPPRCVAQSFASACVAVPQLQHVPPAARGPADGVLNRPLPVRVSFCSKRAARARQSAAPLIGAHVLPRSPPLPPKSQPIEAMSRFVLSDDDDVELSEEEFLRARLRGLQAYLNRLLSIPCVSWCKRFATFLEPDSGQMNVASEGMMTGVYGLQRSQFGLAVALLQQQSMVRTRLPRGLPSPLCCNAWLSEPFRMACAGGPTLEACLSWRRRTPCGAGALHDVLRRGWLLPRVRSPFRRPPA